MSNIDETAKITQVFYPRGVFQVGGDDTNSRRYAKAPFDLVKMEKVEGGVFDEFIMPVQCLWGSGHDVVTQNTNHEREGFGYIADIMVVGEHEIGAWDVDDDGEDNPTWKRCFFLGQV